MLDASGWLTDAAAGPAPQSHSWTVSYTVPLYAINAIQHRPMPTVCIRGKQMVWRQGLALGNIPSLKRYWPKYLLQNIYALCCSHDRTIPSLWFPISSHLWTQTRHKSGFVSPLNLDRTQVRICLTSERYRVCLRLSHNYYPMSACLVSEVISYFPCSVLSWLWTNS